MLNHRILTVVIAVGATTAAVIPTASAAAKPTITVTNPKGCFVNTFSFSPKTEMYTEHFAIIDVSGKGWTPGNEVDVSFNGVDKVTKKAGANGTFTASFKAPEPTYSSESSVAFGTSTVTAHDEGNADGSDPGGTTAISGNVNYTDRETQVWENPMSIYGPTSDFFWSNKVDFRSSGYTPGKTIYAHYLDNGESSYAPAGKLETTTVIGTATGPCGVFTKRRVKIYPTKPKESIYGDYTIWFSTSKTYTVASRQYAFIFNLGL